MKSQPGEQLVEGPQLDVDRLRHRGRDERVVGLRPPCPKARAAARHLAADAPEPDHAQPLAAELDTRERLAIPASPPSSRRRPAARLRARASSSARASSAVETRLPPGEFMTITPRRVAASRSTLSTPTPGRPITFRFLAASSTSAVIWLPLRTGSRGREPRSSPARPAAGPSGCRRPAFGPQDLGAALGDALEDEDLVAQICQPSPDRTMSCAERP